MRRRRAVDFTTGPVFGNIVRFTVPIILMNILQFAFNATDLAVVGKFSGSASVAAVGATGSLISLIIGLFVGLSVGAGVSAAQAIGAGDRVKTSKTVHTAIFAALICGFILTVVGVFACRSFLTLMHTPEDIIDLSMLYMKIYFCGCIPNMVYVFGAAIMRASGDTKKPLYFLTIAGVCNVGLNLLMVAVFKMDVAGVAIATVISQTLSAVLVLASLCRREDASRFIPSAIKIDKGTLWFMFKIGMPSGLQASLFSVANVVLQSSVNTLGSSVVSGSAAAASIEYFVWVITNSFYQTTITAAGQNIGAKKYDRIGKSLRCSCLCVIVLGIAAGTLAYLFRVQLLHIYLDDETAIYYGALRLSAYCLFYFLCGLNDAISGALGGCGHSLTPMFISFIGICGVRILWANTVFLKPQYHNIKGLYFSYPVSWLITVSAVLIAYLIVKKRDSKRRQKA